MELDAKTVVKMMVQAQKRPDNTLMLRLPVLILTARSWETKDKEKMFTYKAFSAENQAVLEFNSSKVHAPNKRVEVVLTLSGFRAFEAVR